MKCTHPKQPENLVDGKCATCKQVKEMRAMARESKGELRKCLNSLVEFFVRGDFVVDAKNGKSLLELEKELRKKL
jgi:hypothetical protein